MTLARKILGNTIAQVLGRFVTAFLAIIVVKILATYLGQAGYGKYATIYEFLAFFGAFADFGIFTIAVREMSREKSDQEAVFSNALTLRTLFTATAMLLGAGAGFLVPQYQHTVIPVGILIASLSTFFVILSGTLSVALQVRLRMEFAAFALVLGKVFTVAIVLLITQSLFPVATEESFFLLIWAGTVGAGFTFLLTLLWTRASFPVRFRFDKTLSKKLLLEAAPFAIALALNTLYIRLDILLLSLLLPPSENGICDKSFCGDTEVGAYAVAARILEILLMIPIYFMNSVLPTLTERITKVSDSLFRLLRNAFSFLLAVGVPAGILLFVLSKETTELISSASFLSTPDQAGADTALRILSGMVSIAFLSMFFGFLLIASGRQKELIRINFLTVSFNILLDLLLIPNYGFVGAAWGSFFSEFIMLSLMIFATKKYIHFSPDIRSLKIIASAGGAGALCFGIHAILAPLGTLPSFGGTLLVFVGFYAGNLWITGVLSKEVLGEVLGRKEKSQ